jgi:hypothetical protein
MPPNFPLSLPLASLLPFLPPSLSFLLYLGLGLIFQVGRFIRVLKRIFGNADDYTEFCASMAIFKGKETATAPAGWHCRMTYVGVEGEGRGVREEEGRGGYTEFCASMAIFKGKETATAGWHYRMTYAMERRREKRGEG